LCAHRFLWSQCAQLGTLRCTDLTAGGAGGCPSDGRRRWWVSERSRGAGLQALVGIRALTGRWTPEGGPCTRVLEAIAVGLFFLFQCFCSLRAKKLDGKPPAPAPIRARARHAEYCARKGTLSKANQAMTSDLTPSAAPTNINELRQRIPSPPTPVSSMPHASPVESPRSRSSMKLPGPVWRPAKKADDAFSRAEYISVGPERSTFAATLNSGEDHNGYTQFTFAQGPKYVGKSFSTGKNLYAAGFSRPEYIDSGPRTEESTLRSPRDRGGGLYTHR
jgi:hypothetical protein